MAVGLLVALVAALGLGSCETVGFYRQAAVGQSTLMADREPVEAVLADPDTEPRLAARLQYVERVLDYAESRLGLEVGKRYQSYVALDREFVLYNVYAAPEFSVEARRWCYPIAGCVVYRGYFDEHRARAKAAVLQADGLDTYVGGVAAYSSLGWFNDPILSSFAQWSEPALADLLFHELAHSRVFVAGDSDFSESYATFVGRQGVREWLRSQGTVDLTDVEAHWRARDRLSQLLLRYRRALSDLYQQPYSAFVMRSLKAAVFEAMTACYRSDPRLNGRFDNVFDSPFNNARLVPVAAYDALLPAFGRLFQSAHGNWQEFHNAAAERGSLNADDRAVELARLVDQEIAAGSDDQSTDQVQCETLTHHAVDGESTGGKHDDVGGGSDR
jgi:predicted aminopeptidase